ncbi:hypothetical protein EV363DRAFT_1172203 [Boletus edulis]|nr:hypothetical protein EV363DRAFT_1172203 [Boletus edulis]
MTTPLLDILAAHLPPAIELASLPSSSLEIILAFALGADCPLPDQHNEWARTQPAALRAFHDALGPSNKRTRGLTPTTSDPAPKRQKTTDDADDPPRFTLPSISTTSPIRKKVDLTVHARSIRFVNPTTRVLEASVPLASITRAFLLPTRGKPKGHWTVVLLPTDVPDKTKSAVPSTQQVIFGLDARSAASFETISYTPATSTTTVAKGEDTVSAVRSWLAHIPVPLLEPSATVFRSACATPKSGHGAAGVDAYLAAKSGTLWFFDLGVLWGEGKPCEFWAIDDLIPKDGVRLISATGRTCSVIFSRKVRGTGREEDDEDEDVVETAFSMVDGKEQDPIDAWARHRKHRFGKSPAPVANGNGTAKGPAWDDSDSDDADFEVASSEDLEHGSSDEGEDSEGEGGSGAGSADDGGSLDSEGVEESGEEEELDEARHPLLRPGAMPRMSKAAIEAAVDMVHRDLVEDASEEEDELEE